MDDNFTLPQGPIGDDGMRGYDESQEQEDYMTYQTYLSLVEEGGCTEEEALELLELTQEKVSVFIEQFEPSEESLEE